MGEEKVETAVVDDTGNKIVALKVLQEMYSNQLNVYERQIDEVSSLGRVNRNTLYNPAVLHEIEAMAQRKKFEELLSAVWIAQSMLEDIIALQRTVCVLKRSMADEAIEKAEKKERDIDTQALPYEEAM
ncbi:MAG TPA: hypothetical protein PLR51_02530 [Methanomassiliicoccales archaeon]|nr:hypothetical protein [Methanomassiliicoccales archaeon]HQQ25137.1 hypothetical protein [Methanomassiliicoccales archaeon]